MQKEPGTRTHHISAPVNSPQTTDCDDPPLLLIVRGDDTTSTLKSACETQLSSPFSTQTEVSFVISSKNPRREGAVSHTRSLQMKGTRHLHLGGQ